MQRCAWMPGRQLWHDDHHEAGGGGELESSGEWREWTEGCFRAPIVCICLSDFAPSFFTRIDSLAISMPGELYFTHPLTTGIKLIPSSTSNLLIILSLCIPFVFVVPPCLIFIPWLYADSSTALAVRTHHF